jgi:hypothetical protein
MQDGVYYVHFFVAKPGSVRRQYHGKALGPDRFRGRIEDRPDTRYIEWHYRQCVMARVRGFASGMEIPETNQAVVAAQVGAWG